MLYENLLQKNIGWFDFKENGTGHLTDVMENDVNKSNESVILNIGDRIEVLFMAIGGIVAMYGSNGGIAGLTCASFVTALIPLFIIHRIEFNLKKEK